jgi:hypothetical protein
VYACSTRMVSIAFWRDEVLRPPRHQVRGHASSNLWMSPPLFRQCRQAVHRINRPQHDLRLYRRRSRVDSCSTATLTSVVCGLSGKPSTTASPSMKEQHHRRHFRRMLRVTSGLWPAALVAGRLVARARRPPMGLATMIGQARRDRVRRIRHKRGHSGAMKFPTTSNKSPVQSRSRIRHCEISLTTEPSPSVPVTVLSNQWLYRNPSIPAFRNAFTAGSRPAPPSGGPWTNRYRDDGFVFLWLGGRWLP